MSTTDLDAARRRRRERLGSAAVRAVGRNPSAELRHQLLYLDGVIAPFAVPYLAVDLADTTTVQARGIADGHGARLRFAEPALYRDHRPAGRLARLVYDMVDQFRCEALLVDLRGARRNVDEACLAWSRSAAGTDFVATAVGTLLYTVLHMVRSHLVHPLGDEGIDTQIEETRSRISPIIGESLHRLVVAARTAQGFFPAAAAFAETVGDLADVGIDDETESRVEDVVALFVPLGWDEIDFDDAGALPTPDLGAPDEVLGHEDLSTVGGYHVFTTAHDVEVAGADLYPVATRLALRQQLDALVSAQAVSVGRLARRLQRLLSLWQADGWDYAQEDGVLDAARLSQLVADPANTRIFRSPRSMPTAPLCVTFLLDNSGSMKRQRYESLAVLVDTLSRALDLAGATSEVLGFTTASWNGGQAAADWRRAGSPADPGRLSARQHIVYKRADVGWRRSRTAIAALLKTQHYREGIDGEALVWAHERLMARPEPRRVLVMVSDGAPMDAATRQANGEVFLPEHLRRVSRAIERAGQVKLVGLSVDLGVEDSFATEGVVDLETTLTMSTYHDLLELMVTPS